MTPCGFAGRNDVALLPSLSSVQELGSQLCGTLLGWSMRALINDGENPGQERAFQLCQSLEGGLAADPWAWSLRVRARVGKEPRVGDEVPSHAGRHQCHLAAFLSERLGTCRG